MAFADTKLQYGGFSGPSSLFSSGAYASAGNNVYTELGSLLHKEVARRDEKARQAKLDQMAQDRLAIQQAQEQRAVDEFNRKATLRDDTATAQALALTPRSVLRQQDIQEQGKLLDKATAGLEGDAWDEALLNAPDTPYRRKEDLLSEAIKPGVDAKSILDIDKATEAARAAIPGTPEYQQAINAKKAAEAKALAEWKKKEKYKASLKEPKGNKIFVDKEGNVLGEYKPGEQPDNSLLLDVWKKKQTGESTSGKGKYTDETGKIKTSNLPSSNTKVYEELENMGSTWYKYGSYDRKNVDKLADFTDDVALLLNVGPEEALLYTKKVGDQGGFGSYVIGGTEEVSTNRLDDVFKNQEVSLKKSDGSIVNIPVAGALKSLMYKDKNGNSAYNKVFKDGKVTLEENKNFIAPVLGGGSTSTTTKTAVDINTTTSTGEKKTVLSAEPKGPLNDKAFRDDAEIALLESDIDPTNKSPYEILKLINEKASKNNGLLTPGLQFARNYYETQAGGDVGIGIKAGTDFTKGMFAKAAEGAATLGDLAVKAPVEAWKAISGKSSVLDDGIQTGFGEIARSMSEISNEAAKSYADISGISKDKVDKALIGASVLLGGGASIAKDAGTKVVSYLVKQGFKKEVAEDASAKLLRAAIKRRSMNLPGAGTKGQRLNILGEPKVQPSFTFKPSSWQRTNTGGAPFN